MLRDFEVEFGFEVAADIHVFWDEQDQLRGIYSGPNPMEDRASIKLATAAAHESWEPGPVVLGPGQGALSQLNKETSFYRRADSGKH